MKWAYVFLVASCVTAGAYLPGRIVSRVVAVPAAATTPAYVPPPPGTETVVYRGLDGQFVTSGDVNDVPVRFVVDTGADMVALTEGDARRAGIAFSPQHFVPVARSASGVAMGQKVTLRSVSLDGKRVTEVHGAVIRGLEVSLLGQSYLGQMHRIVLERDEMRLR